MQVAEDVATEAVLGEHAANGVFHHCERFALQLLFCSANTLSAWVARVADVFFGLHFVAGQHNLLCVHHHNVIAAVGVGGEVGLVLAAQQRGNL